MPIHIKVFLTQCETHFLEILSNMEEQHQSLSQIFLKPYVFAEPELILETEEDAEDLIISSLYLELFDLINHSLTTKHKLLEALPQDEFIELPKKENNFIKNLCKIQTQKPEIWLKLFLHPTHRLMLYFFLNAALLNPELSPLDLNKAILKSLHQSASSSQECMLINYLNFLIHNNLTPGKIIINESVTNPYLVIHYKLQFFVPEDKLIEISNIPFSFPEQVPSFIQKTVHMGFIYMMFKKLHALHLGYTDLMTLLHHINPAFLCFLNQDIKFTNSDFPIELCYNFYWTLKVYTRTYTLRLEEKFYTKGWFGFLSFYNLKMFQSMSREEKRKLRGLDALLRCCDELIKTDAYLHWNLYQSSPQEFWEICSALINQPLVMGLEFIKFSCLHLPIILENLVRFKLWTPLKLSIDAYIERSEIFPIIEPEEKSTLNAIILHLNFLQEFPEIEPEADLKQISSLIQRFIEDKGSSLHSHAILPTSSLKKKYAQLVGCMIECLMNKLLSFSSHFDFTLFSDSDLDNLYLLQKNIFIFLKNLNASAADIDAAKLALKEDELLTRRLEDFPLSLNSCGAGAGRSNRSKKKSARSSASIVSKAPSPAPDPKKSPAILEKTQLPSILLELAATLKTELGAKLILNGGAVTNLYLKRSNPHDFDCLVFGYSLEHLALFLEGQGFKHLQIVGKVHPILKMHIQDEALELDIDISSIEKVEHGKIHEQMAEILSHRDFKLNALYIEIDPDLDYLEIKGYDHALHSVNLKQISAVENSKRHMRCHIFNEDPIRAFRLVKNMLQYPDFEPDSTLNRILKLNPLTNILKEFIKQDLNQSRIGTYIERLFFYFEPDKVIRMMGQFKIIEGLFNLKYSKLLPYLEVFDNHCKIVEPPSYAPFFFKSDLSPSPRETKQIQAYTLKLRFFQFITAVYFIENPLHTWEDWQASGLVHKLKPIDHLGLNIIYLHREAKILINHSSDPLLALVAMVISKRSESTQNLAVKSSCPS